METRGGQQRIPRPVDMSPGPSPLWAGLDETARRFDLDAVRAALTPALPGSKPPRGVASRDAAVLVALFEVDGEARVVLTKRPETMPSHQGEIAFPGGKYDPDVDASLAHAALREAHEEVDLDPGLVEVIGELDTLSTVASQFVITPFVGLLAEPPRLVPHPREVVKVFDVALSDLFDAKTYRSEIWRFPTAANDINIHFYELPGETVWGATARILTNLLTKLAASREH